MRTKIIRRTLYASAHKIHHHPVLHRVYAARGIQSEHELNYSLDELIPYQQLLGIEQAVDCLYQALLEQQKILIVGDFDADGATSTAVAIRALKSFGATEVDYLVPNRFSFGYGLTPELVEIAKTLQPALIVTVDNGIANHAGVTAAKTAGIKVVITDHHLAADTLPDADAIVNPNQPGDTFSSKNLAGVGVIFYVMLALRRLLCDKNWFSQKQLPEPNMSRLLDIVALGTVADVVPLDRNNRILVQQGLRRIRAGQCVPGITALLKIAGRNQARIVAADLGFAVAPRLNAAGRLDDMSLGIECLLCENEAAADEAAHILNKLNEERRVIEHDMQEQALHILKTLPADASQHGLCLFNEGWHQGVIGILASRIKDRLHCPVIAFARANEYELKGSARSIAGLHIRDVLAYMAAHYPDLIFKFGGHAMAAGLTLPAALFPRFAEIFSKVVAKITENMALPNALMTDGELTPDELTLDVAEVIRESGPWGQAFPEPAFDGLFTVLEQRLVGSKHLKLTLGKDQKIIDAIAFNIDLNLWPNHRCDIVNIVYRLDVNEYRSRRNIQLIVEQLEAITQPVVKREWLTEGDALPIV